MSGLDKLAGLVADMPSDQSIDSSDIDHQYEPAEEPKPKAEARANPEQGDQPAGDEPAGDEPTDPSADQVEDDASADESATDPGDDNDEPAPETEAETDDIVVMTVNNQEIKLPADTPKAAVEVIKKAEKDLKSAFTQNNMRLEEERRTVNAAISEAEARALEGSKAEAQKVQALLQNLVPLTSREQLAELRRNDRDAYEDARDRNEELIERHGELRAQIAQIDANIAEKKKAATAARAHAAWTELSEKWYDGDTAGNADKLQSRVSKIFTDTAKNYKIYGEAAQEEFFGGVLNSKLVMIMEDAAKWQTLQASKPDVTKRVTKSAKAAPAKAPQTTQERQQQQRERDGKFRKNRYSIHETAERLSALGI